MKRYYGFLLIFWFLIAAAELHAQQHQPDLKWRTLKTPHFSVHFPAGSRPIAEKIATICEQVYEPVGRSLHYFPARTQVVVHTRSDLSNGFVTALPWRMELFITEPQHDLIGSRDDWLRILIAHEFTHVVQGRKVGGLSRLTYPLFGELNSFWHNIAPRWYAEGFATRNETHFTRGGRGRNAFHLMRLLAPLQTGRPWALANTSFPSRKRLPLDMNYVAGYYLTDYISEKYGDDTWAQILDRYMKFPLLGFGHAARHITGKKLSTLYAEMLDKYRQQAKKPAGAETTLIPLSPQEVPENQLSPRWLPDGNLVFYRSSFGALPEIVQWRPGKGTIALRQRAAFNANTILTAGPRAIVWAETNPHIRYAATEYADLMLLDRQTGAMRQLTHSARVYSPDLSPDGRRIVAVQTQLPGNRLVLVSTETGETTPLLELKQTSFFDPRWSPDGSSIAFALKDSTAWQDIAVLDLGRRKWRRLLPRDSFHDASPCWTPDGRYILFSSDRDGRFALWAVSLATGELRQVAAAETGVFSPDVSRDGRMLAATVYTEGGFRVITRRLDPQHWQPVQSRPITAGEPIAGSENGAPGPLAPARGSWIEKKYDPLGQILRPQGWFPYAAKDEHGDALGFYAFSADALHRHDWQGYLTFSTANLNPSWDVQYNYRRWWPEFSLRSYSDADEIPPVEFNNQLFSGWWRKHGLELSLGVPLTLEQNVYTTFFRPFVAVRGENRTLSAGSLRTVVQDYLRRFRGVQAGFQLFRATQTALDVVPHRAVVIALQADWSSELLKSQFRAQQYTSLLNLFLPTLIRHHQLQLQLNFTTRGGNFGFNSFRSYPIGYGDSGRRKLLRAKAAYHFPIAYTEWQVPLLPVFIDYLAGAVFYDWGTSWNHGRGGSVWRQNSRAAMGVQISANLYLFQSFPSRVGLALFYQDETGDLRLEPTLGLNF